MHLTNVFYNLIDSGIKYSGPEALITVTCKSVYDRIIVTVRDDGQGIPKMYHNRIFERFFRIPENLDIHILKGTGLGLHYVKQIIVKHGGNITVSTESGTGSLFIINLPAYHEI
nr:ATP-binding protein [uncultured Chryseobacterium sp.]